LKKAGERIARGSQERRKSGVKTQRARM